MENALLGAQDVTPWVKLPSMQFSIRPEIFRSSNLMMTSGLAGKRQAITSFADAGKVAKTAGSAAMSNLIFAVLFNQNPSLPLAARRCTRIPCSLAAEWQAESTAPVKARRLIASAAAARCA